MSTTISKTQRQLGFGRLKSIRVFVIHVRSQINGGAGLGQAAGKSMLHLMLGGAALERRDNQSLFSSGFSR